MVPERSFFLLADDGINLIAHQGVNRWVCGVRDLGVAKDTADPKGSHPFLSHTFPNLRWVAKVVYL